jgi:hypothetical protein
MSLRVVVACAATLMLGAGKCIPDPTTDAGTDPPEAFDCELGVPGYTAMDFIPLSESNESELQLGFQGLSFAPVRVRMAADAPDELDVVASVAIEGLEPIGMSLNSIEPLVLDDGQRLTRDLQLPINRGSFSEYVGRSAHVAIRLSDDYRAPTQLCVVEGDIVFVDDDECIHTGDIPLCPDAGPSSDEDAGPTDEQDAGPTDPTDAGPEEG